MVLQPTLNDGTRTGLVSMRAIPIVEGLFGLGAAFLSSAQLAFATDDITSGITSGMGSLYNVLKGVAIPIAAIAAVLCAFYIFVGGEKGMEKAKKVGLYTAIGIAIVFLGPLLVNTVKGWFESAGQSAANTVFGTGG